MNTKQDYINLKETEKGKRALKNLLDYRFIWQSTKVLDTAEEGIQDQTHRVIPDELFYIQQEWVEDCNALIFRLRFTVEEVEALLEEVENVS